MGERDSISERMRYRDLELQVKRFVKFAPRGTDKATLVREAEAFSRRLDAIPALYRGRQVQKLKRELKGIWEAASEAK